MGPKQFFLSSAKLLVVWAKVRSSLEALGEIDLIDERNHVNQRIISDNDTLSV
jgi:hypothetical protein